MFVVIVLTTMSCKRQEAIITSTNTFSDYLTAIEKEKNMELLGEHLDEDVLLYIPDAPPIYSKDVVIDLFKYLWNRENVDTNIAYSKVSTKKIGNQINEKGIYSFIDSKGKHVEMPYSIVGYKTGKGYLIKEIVYNNSKQEIDDLPEPSGKYNVGQSIHYYEKSINISRPIAFQIWYPTLDSSAKKIPFQSKGVAEAFSNFLNWPSFNNSFTRLMNSNSSKDVDIVPNKKFPVLLYNHGYGGATTVYQTICEELASHGYIVVSIGHQDESAFFLKEDGSVIQNSPDNEFYTRRVPEISNSTIGEEQSTILNSDDPGALAKAYKKLVELSPLHTESVNLWVWDTKNVINKLKELNDQNKYLKGSFDFENMGIFGHSVGGATAGELGSKNDFKAGINIDGFQFGNLINSKLQIPFLFISSNEVGNRYLRIDPFAKTSSKKTYHAIVKGFSHSSFSDLQLFASEGLRDIELQRRLILDFFNKFLKNDNVDLEALNKEFKNLRITINSS